MLPKARFLGPYHLAIRVEKLLVLFCLVKHILGQFTYRYVKVLEQFILVPGREQRGPHDQLE